VARRGIVSGGGAPVRKSARTVCVLGRARERASGNAVGRGRVKVREERDGRACCENRRSWGVVSTYGSEA
jgi:hypothetical protein